jgi:hypothetical protein
MFINMINWNKKLVLFHGPESNKTVIQVTHTALNVFPLLIQKPILNIRELFSDHISFAYLSGQTSWPGILLT